MNKKFVKTFIPLFIILALILAACGTEASSNQGTKKLVPRKKK